MSVVNIVPSAMLEHPRAVRLERRRTMSSIPQKDLWGGESTPARYNHSSHKAAYDRERYRRNRGKIQDATRKWRKSHLEQHVAYTQKWQKLHPDKRREAAWRYQGINITWEQYLTMLQSQDYRCKICGAGIDTSAHVDHNHTTGKIRGLLCDTHNKALGMFGDSLSILESAVSYMKENDIEA